MATVAVFTLPASAQVASDSGHARVAPPQPPRDEVVQDPNLPPGTISVELKDLRGQPLPDREVKLEVNRESIAEGNSTRVLRAMTGATGAVTFADNPISTEHSYRVLVDAPPAKFYSHDFPLNNTRGQRVVQHILPVTHDMRQALIGTRGMVVVQPREEVFRFDVSWRIYNVGQMAWVPQDFTVALPKGHEALTSREMGTDQRIVATGDVVRLEGTFPPGQHDLGFSFNIDNPYEAEQRFTIGLPPRMADVQILAEEAPGMKLDVPGLRSAIETTHTTGQKFLVVAEDYVRSRRASPGSVTIALSGLPTPSSARWIAVVLTSAFILLGLGIVLRGRHHRGESVDSTDLKQARELILQELVLLEKARSTNKIGVHAYERTRRTLLDSVVRLDARLGA